MLWCVCVRACARACEDTGKGKFSVAAKLDSRLEQTFLFSRADTTAP